MFMKILLEWTIYKNVIKKISSTIVLFAVFFSMNAQNMICIDLTQAKFGQISANSIFEEIKYVPLETHKGGLLDIKIASYYLTDKYIIAMNFCGGAYLFDRETGKFIREVSSFGPGPDEYKGPLYNHYGFDEKNKILFATDAGPYSRLWKCINIETNKVESTINKPLGENNNVGFDKEAPWLLSVQAPWLLKDNFYISFCNNRSGKDKIRLVIFDKEGTVIKEYPNYLEYKDANRNRIPASNGIFYYYNENTYFKEMNYNDTVFRVDENRMSPHIIFNLGNKQPSYYHQQDVEFNKGKYLINLVSESNSFIIFNFSYFTETVRISGLGITDVKNNTLHSGYYDKKSKQTYISSTPDFKQSGYSAIGIPVSFHPVSINKNKEMITCIDPEELMKHRDRIDVKYRHLFQNIQADDNPIVIIAKLKE